MKFYLSLIVSLFYLDVSYGQEGRIIETRDIDNFWLAFDKLSEAESNADSIEIIQTFYLDSSTTCFKEFIRLRNFTAKEYIKLIGKYPKFWHSIRAPTENLKHRKQEIDNLFDTYEKALPDFKRSDVCFTIGCLRTGGTIAHNLILIGSEISASNAETDKSELTPWLQSVIGSVGDVVSMVSHETIHTQQKSKKLRNLAEFAMNEGTADFLSEKIAGFNINKVSFAYGQENDCELRKAFLADFKNDKKDISNWLFNGNRYTQRPADLGYYMGYKIAEDFYERSSDKQEAIRQLLDTHNYMKIFRKSKYLKEGCN